jgi:hypothetical protein
VYGAGLVLAGGGLRVAEHAPRTVV